MYIFSTYSPHRSLGFYSKYLALVEDFLVTQMWWLWHAVPQHRSQPKALQGNGQSGLELYGTTNLVMRTLSVTWLIADQMGSVIRNTYIYQVEQAQLEHSSQNPMRILQYAVVYQVLHASLVLDRDLYKSLFYSRFDQNKCTYVAFVKKNLRTT